MTAEKRQWRLNIISVWVGILIPIVAALIPYVYRQVIPEHDLTYKVIGPISVKGTTALSVEISNEGEHLERNVKVWLPTFLTYQETKPGAQELTVDAEVPVNINTENGKFVLLVGDIRPNEKTTISVSSDRISVYGSMPANGVSVKSDENVGTPIRPSELEQFFYPVGFWAFIVLMIFILVMGVYQQYFMDPKTREALVLKEIDKLEKARGAQ